MDEVIYFDMELGEMIARERQARGWSQADLGRRIGISQAAIAKIEAGQTLKSKWLPELTSLLNIPMTGSQPDYATPQKPEALANILSNLPQDVPVKGVVVGGSDGDFSFNGSVAEYVKRPPGLATANGVYAVYVTSDSMAPRFEPSDLIFVSSSRAPVIGDYVVVELYGEIEGEPGKGYIKRLVKRSGSVLRLHQFNPDADIEIDASKVKLIHRVFSNNDLFG